MYDTIEQVTPANACQECGGTTYPDPVTLLEHVREVHTPTPGPYAEPAAELHHIADALATVTGDMPRLYLALNVSPYGQDLSDDAKTAVVDAVATALLGVKATTRHMSSGSWHHTVHGRRGPVHLSIYDAVSNPATRDKDAELEQLRVRLAEAQAAVAAARASRNTTATQGDGKE